MSLRHLCGVLAALVLLTAPAMAQRQPLYQDGTVVPNHLGKFTTQGRSSDVGGITGDALGHGVAPFAIDDAKGAGIRFRDTPSATGPYHEFTLGHDADGNAVLTVESVNGASLTDLYCNINGVTRLCFGGVVFNDTQTENISAAGQDQAHATALGSTYREHVITAGTGGVALPTCGATSTIHTIVNLTGAQIRLYPVSGGTDSIKLNGGIQLAANIPMDVHSSATLVCRASGQWSADVVPRIVGAGPLAIRDFGAALQATLDPVALTGMLLQLGYQPTDPTNAVPMLWTPIDVSGDALTFPSPSCGGGGASCTVCTIEGLLTHVSADIVWPTNSGTHAPAVSGLPETCFPSSQYVSHYAVGQVNCPGSGPNALTIVPIIHSASSGNATTVPDGKGVIEVRSTTTAITNATLSEKQCVFNFTFTRDK